MTLLFYLGHPAHYHLFKTTISEFEKKGVTCIILIKTKDVLESLLKNDNLKYINIQEDSRKTGKLNLVVSLVQKTSKIFQIVKQNKPDFLIGSAVELTIVGKLLGIPSFIFFEDDFIEVKQFAKIAGPLATELICPISCSAWKWERRAIKYSGYHELAYLQPKYFIPDSIIAKKTLDLSKKNFIIRLSALNAYHDDNVSGININFATKIIELLKPYGNIYITSERELEPEFEKYRISIKPTEIHHAMAFSDLYIGDSQTMAAEAAILGVPSLRYNDFVGKLGYLEELEHKWGLTFGFKTNQQELLLEKLKELLQQKNIKQVWEQKRKAMLNDSIDVNAFMTWFIENYPASKKEIKNSPEFWAKFK
jgi:predicted glycosyltransferase